MTAPDRPSPSWHNSEFGLWTVRLSAVTVVCAALLLFVIIAGIVHAGLTTGLDDFLRARIHDHATPLLTRLMKHATTLGSAVFWVPVTVVGVLLLVWKRRLSAARFFLITMMGSASLQFILKHIVRRPRPAPFFGLAMPDTYSFPSGHALDAFCFYSVVALLVLSRLRSRRARVWVVVVCVLLIVAVGVSRVYLGMHYPSDVLAGYLAGLAWTGSVFIGVRKAATGPL
jgi:undecaprenyl-diphosphatase